MNWLAYCIKTCAVGNGNTDGVGATPDRGTPGIQSRPISRVVISSIIIKQTDFAFVSGGGYAELVGPIIVGLDTIISFLIGVDVVGGKSVAKFRRQCQDQSSSIVADDLYHKALGCIVKSSAANVVEVRKSDGAAACSIV